MYNMFIKHCNFVNLFNFEKNATKFFNYNKYFLYFFKFFVLISPRLATWRRRVWRLDHAKIGDLTTPRLATWQRWDWRLNSADTALISALSSRQSWRGQGAKLGDVKSPISAKSSRRLGLTGLIYRTVSGYSATPKIRQKSNVRLYFWRGAPTYKG